jgi:hypothetical protein
MMHAAAAAAVAAACVCSPNIYDVVGLPKHGGASTGALDAIAKEDLFAAVQHHACVPHTLNLQQAGGQ